MWMWLEAPCEMDILEVDGAVIGVGGGRCWIFGGGLCLFAFPRSGRMIVTEEILLLLVSTSARPRILRA